MKYEVGCRGVLGLFVWIMNEKAFSMILFFLEKLVTWMVFICIFLFPSHESHRLHLSSTVKHVYSPGLQNLLQFSPADSLELTKE